MGIYRGFPVFYPIFPFFLPGEQGGLCAEWSSISHTFGSWKASLRLISLTIPRVEPRASSPRIVDPVYT